jgi:hypothetical protein
MNEIYTQGLHGYTWRAEIRLLEGPRRSQEGNIKMAVEQIGSECVDWINLAQYREKFPAAVNAAVNQKIT